MNKAIKFKKKPKRRPGRATGGLLVWLVRFFTDLIKTLREAWHREQGRLSTGGGGGGGGGSTPTGRPAHARPGRPSVPTSSGPRVDGTRVGPPGAPGHAIHGQGNGRSWPGSSGATTNGFEDSDMFEDDDLDDEESTDDGQDDGASGQSEDAGPGSEPGADAGDGGGEMGGDGSGGAA